MNILEMRNIHKAFVGVPVLKDVELVIRQGEVHALLGENGAGKSTLMNILTGVYTLDKGTVQFDGKDITNCSIRESEAMGIAFVHQELNLFNDLRVYENIFFNKELANKIGTLKKHDRLLFTRRYFTLQSTERIAADLGMTPNAVSIRLCRLRAALRQELRKEDIPV